ncbi:Ig-like domain-containing protein [Paenibacillus athensensis]|uniref:Dockerin domain-containing protein n=1 Tax=Paenibacillus athensensis TaxID=1967502 RepID=A0A4Y8Q538_9BACL|nr:Ig-like domain-containing protein [Paenibacillus athensensis]MCD1259621.1 Ig-like domain-containing protein [Paenibacillus athensensis]
MKKSLKQINAGQRIRTVSALTALLMAVPMVMSPTVSATLPNKVMTPVSSDLGWIASPITVANDTFSFDASGHFPQLTNTPVAISASSSSSAVADASATSGVVQVQVKSPGTFRLAVKGTDQSATALTDNLDVTVTLLGDTNGDGVLNSTDVLYITKVVNSKLPLTDEVKNRLDINRDGQVTSADASLLMSSYVGKTPVTGGVAFIVALKGSNDAPVADQGTIVGTAHTGLTVTGDYRYLDAENDAEGVSLYQWYRGLQEDGSDRTAIAGATATTYTLQDDDVDHYVFFEVTPVDAEGEAGTPMRVHTDNMVPDTTPPQLSVTVPQSGASNASFTDALVATFNEDVLAAAGKMIKIRYASDNSVAASYSANDTSKVTVSGKTVTIVNPGLDDGTGYYVEVEAGAFTDLVGNPFAGFSGGTGWSFATPDTIAPTALTYSPVNGVTNASKSADLSVTFSENVVAAAGKTVKIRKTGDDSVVASYSANDTTNVSISGALVTIHNPGLDEVVGYYVEIEAGAFTDAAGNSFAGVSGNAAWHFDTPDTTAPTVSSTTPADDATGVSLSTPLSITFSEPVTAVAGHTIKLRKQSDNSEIVSYSVTDTSKVTVSGATVSFENPGLVDETSYYVEIEAGAFTDSSGNGFAGLSGSAAWGFTTPDTIAPTVGTYGPARFATTASKSADLTLAFSEPVKAVAGKTVKIFNKADDTEKVSYTADDTTKVTISGSTVTIHNPGLDEVSSYYVEIEAGAFTDMSGNEYTGLSGSSAWTFTTPDSIAPTLVSTTPLDDATGVTRTADLTLEFSEPVVAASGKYVTIRRAGDNSIMKQYTANDTTGVSISGATVTLLSPNLDDGGSFYVEVDAGAFTDPTGNAFAGISGTTAWSFTTPDTIAPTISSTTPLDNATRVNRTADLTVTFSEPVTAVNGKTVVIRNAADDSAFATYTIGTDPEVSFSGNTLTIQHADFIGLTHYYVEIEAGAVVDAAGNAFTGVSGTTVWNFQAADSRIIDMTTAAPLSESNLNGAVITLELTGDTFSGSLGASDFQLDNAPSGLTIGSVARTDGTHATITLAFDSTDFDVDVTNFTVTAKASALTGGGTLTTDVATIAALAEPYAVNTTPANNATGIDKSANLSMTFDRNVTAVAGKTITIYRKSDNAVIQTINANDTSKVTVSGSTVTVQHNAFNGGTNYYVLVQQGAFVDGNGLGSEPITSSTAWSFTTSATTDMYFSEFLRGSGSHQVAIELYYPTSSLPNPAPSKTYSVFVYQYNTTTSSMEISEIKINAEAYKGVPLIIIDGAFYDFMDITTSGQFSAGYQYFNQDDVIYDMSPRVLKALVLKKGSQVLDVIGDPNATGPGSFLASGGTLVRKSGVVGDTSTYDPTQWNVFPVDTFNKIGNHTP